MPNPLNMRGISFIEFSAQDPEPMRKLFKGMGFSRIGEHRGGGIDHLRQNGIHFTLNHKPGTFAAAFNAAHGPSVSAMGWLVEDAGKAFDEAVARGAKPFIPSEAPKSVYDAPAIYGIGDSLIYFLEDTDAFFEREFAALKTPVRADPKGFFTIDHLTNNVYKGELMTWSNFYKDVFGFEEIRYFDIRGKSTGLLSYALRSPCGTFSIPINEGTEHKSQIEEYLREYKGQGVQHIALASPDLLASLDRIEDADLSFLDIEDSYYAEAFQRVPNVTEDKDRIKGHQVLVDGDEEGYLLQIFTQNVIGPIFFELIQRKNHFAFGEGNFGALFRSIERDQERRGVL